MNGTPAIFFNEKGAQVPTFEFSGSTYLPVRSAGEWLGASVQWDGQNNTISLQTGESSTVHADSDLRFVKPSPCTDPITVTERKDIKVLLNGSPCTFTNAKGLAIYPISYQDVTYLPVRSIASLCGMDVVYDSPKAPDGASRPTIFLRNAVSDEQQQEIENYIAAELALRQELLDITGTALKENDLQELREFAQSAQSIILKMQNLLKPSAKLADYYCTLLDKELAERAKGATLILSGSDSPAQIKAGRDLLCSTEIFPGYTGIADAISRLSIVLEQKVG